MRKIVFLSFLLATTAAFATKHAHANEFGAFYHGRNEEQEKNLPDTEEYKNVKPGMLLEEEKKEENPFETTEEDGPNDRVYTMDEIRQKAREGKYKEFLPSLTKLADNGHHEAEEFLGIMYRSGQGVDKDMQKAFFYLSRSADANLPLSQHFIGVMYYMGEGVDKDLVKSLMWLKIALVHYKEGPERDRARKDADNIFMRLTRREKDRADELARDWLQAKGEAHLLDLQ